MLLAGKVAVVTGGGHGIGREVNKLLALEGVKNVTRRLVRGRSWSPFDTIAQVKYSLDQGKGWQRRGSGV